MHRCARLVSIILAVAAFIVLAGNCHSALGSSQLSPNDIYLQALSCKKFGDFEKALMLLDQLVGRYPEYQKGYVLRAEVKQKLGDRSGADEDLEKVAGLMGKTAGEESGHPIVIGPLPDGVKEMKFSPYMTRSGDLKGQSIIKNAHGQQIRVFERNGKVEQVLFNRGDRQFSLLQQGELAVTDFVMERVSRNHNKFYLFPGKRPTHVTFDEDGNLEVTFANGDRMVRDAETFDLIPERSDFAEKKEHSTYRNGTRTLPSIKYTGDRAVLRTIWWEYPPSGGTFTVLNGQKSVGKLPASKLYKKVDEGGGYDVKRLFVNLFNKIKSIFSKRSDSGSKEFLETMEKSAPDLENENTATEVSTEDEPADPKRTIGIDTSDDF